MLETTRLQIRPMTLEDADFVLSLLNSEGWLKYIGSRDVHNLADARRYIQEKMIDHYQLHGFGNYLVLDKQNGTKMACVSLYRREDFAEVDIGFASLPAFLRKGYTYEAASSVLAYAESELKLPVVTAFTTKENLASQALIEKLGLSLTKEFIWKDTKEEMLLYEIKFTDPKI